MKPGKAKLPKPILKSKNLQTDNHKDVASIQLSSLGAMPLEIWEIIISFLEPHQLASLALVSKSSFSYLGHRLSKKLPGKSEELHKFLRLLEKDNTNLLTCYTCVKLYRWRTPENDQPRLCPNRGNIAHLTYGHLDIQNHNRRVEREILDLIIRETEQPGSGLTAQHLLKIIREDGSLDRKLTLPVYSNISTLAYPTGELMIETTTEFRVNANDKLHPFYHLGCGSDPGNMYIPTFGPQNLRLPVISSIFRYTGFSYHEKYEHKRLSKKAIHEFYYCYNCQSGMRIARREIWDRWIVLKVDTAQHFGTPYLKLGNDSSFILAGLRWHHRDDMPDKLVNIMTCSADGTASTGPFCMSTVPPSNPNGFSEGDLGIWPWMSRHTLSYRRRIWPTSTDNEYGSGEVQEEFARRGETNPVIDSDGICQWPLFSNSEWSDGDVTGAIDTYEPLRRRWARQYAWDLPRNFAKNAYHVCLDGLHRSLKKLTPQRGAADGDDATAEEDVQGLSKEAGG